jgi:predicted enzyme related to lactoylglutathione lyase
MARAHRLAEGPSIAYRYMKENLNRAVTGEPGECMDLEVTHHVHTALTDDHREAAQAFMDNREPPLPRPVTRSNSQAATRSAQQSAGREDSFRCAEQTVGMPVQLHHIVIDAHDLPRLARFWTQALGWKVLSEREREIVIGADDNAPVGICFMPVTDPKTVKNRMHLDLTSSASDRAQEIDRLLTLGAHRVDIGQTGTESWTVLADPEGNEFCVVRPKETLTR